MLGKAPKSNQILIWNGDLYLTLTEGVSLIVYNRSFIRLRKFSTMGKSSAQRWGLFLALASRERKTKLGARSCDNTSERFSWVFHNMKHSYNRIKTKVGRPLLNQNSHSWVKLSWEVKTHVVIGKRSPSGQELTLICVSLHCTTLLLIIFLPSSYCFAPHLQNTWPFCNVHTYTESAHHFFPFFSLLIRSNKGNNNGKGCFWV